MRDDLLSEIYEIDGLKGGGSGMIHASLSNRFPLNEGRRDSRRNRESADTKWGTSIRYRLPVSGADKQVTTHTRGLR